ncbi:MAG: hypothetical protein M3Q07_12260, partial [Pseudobdellovibrionaceae bacterium]|nr:hypothetical protein [Pseudobdellovibrionaceae bacterium]
IFTIALIKLGADAGGGTLEAWFWATTVVLPGTILLAQKIKWGSLKFWMRLLLGLSLLCIGYHTMHASIERSEERTISKAAAGSTEVLLLRQQITDLEKTLKPTREAAAAMDPVKYRTTVARMHQVSKPLEDELKITRDQLIFAQNRAATKASAGTASTWSTVEFLRRLMLEPLNILCLHGFLQGLPSLTKVLRNIAFTLRERRMRKRFQVKFAG